MKALKMKKFYFLNIFLQMWEPLRTPLPCADTRPRPAIRDEVNDLDPLDDPIGTDRPVLFKVFIYLLGLV